MVAVHDVGVAVGVDLGRAPCEALVDSPRHEEASTCGPRGGAWPLPPLRVTHTPLTRVLEEGEVRFVGVAKRASLEVE